MDFGTFYQFVNGSLVQVAENAEVDLAVADSWLVEDGAVRNLQLHFERFSRSVMNQSAAPSIQDVADFFEAVVELIPKTGRWFPRVEYHAEKSSPLFVKLRQAPEQLNEATLWTLTEPDPRRSPLTKGPDLSLGMQLRRKAQVHGADEAALVDSQGFLIEGALSSIVWWFGEVLVAPNYETEWLDSITRIEIFEIANQLGLETRTANALPRELEGAEVWLLSSLQGIRRVTRWLDSDGEIPLAPVTSESNKRLASFELRLRMLATQAHFSASSTVRRLNL